MKKDYNSKKKATIAALSLVAVCLAGGLFYYMGALGNTEPPTLPPESKPPVETEIVVPEIESESVTAPETPSAPESTPEVGTPQTEDNMNSEASGTPSVDGDAAVKPSDGKPKSPTEATPPAEPPKETEKQAPVENPDSSGNCQPEQTLKPEQNQPQGGEKRSDGAIYVPGFGWVEDSGEENTTIPAPNAGTGKPVGDM